MKSFIDISNLLDFLTFFLHDYQAILTALIALYGTVYVTHHVFAEIKQKQEIKIRYEIWKKARKTLFKFRGELSEAITKFEFLKTQDLIPSKNKDWNYVTSLDILEMHLRMEKQWSNVHSFLFMCRNIILKSNLSNEFFDRIRKICLDIMTLPVNKQLTTKQKNKLKDYHDELLKFIEKFDQFINEIEIQTIGKIINK